MEKENIFNMKTSLFVKKIISIFLLLSLICPLFSNEEEISNKNNSSDLPQSLQDLRRFEIITLGSMPFVTLDTMLVYSGINYAKTGVFQNPLSSSKNYSEKEIAGIILTSLGISVGIGITDYIVNSIKRNKEKNNRDINKDGIIIKESQLEKENNKENSQDKNSEEIDCNSEEIVGFENIFGRKYGDLSLSQEENKSKAVGVY